MGKLALCTILLLNIIFSFASKLEVQPDTDSEVARHQLQRIYKQTKHMKYGECWTKALEQLQSGCRNLSDEMQRRIAYEFARCHLQSAGRDIPECSQDQAVSECTNEQVLKDSAFNTYTEFFTHTQQICFHLQSQVWHEATENTISKLADNSAEVATTLEQSSVIAREMVERQNVTLKNQEELLRNERLLRENMHKSVLDVQKSHEETKAVIREQRVLFAEVFDRVAALQKTVLGEFTSVYTFGFYIGASVLAYILTSTSRTSSARIWLFVLITLNFATERLVVNYHLAPSSNDGTMSAENTVLPETVYADMWICRKVFSIIALLTMFICIVRYKDYNRINNDLLNEIKRQNIELQTLLKEQGITSFHSFNGVKTPQKQANGNLALCDITKNKTQLNQSQSNIYDKTAVTLNNTDHNESPFVNNDSVFPYDSDDDKTFVGDSSGSESSVSSYVTGKSSQRTSLANDSIMTMMRSFRRSSTPSGDHHSSRRTSRRTSVSSTVSILAELNESVVETEGVIIGGHNLRNRRTMNFKNPIVEKETVAEFIGAVAKVTAHRNHLLQ